MDPAVTKRIDRCSRAVFKRPRRDPDEGVSHIQLPRRFPGPLTSFGKRRVRLRCCVRGVEENHFALLLNPSMSTEHTQAGERTGTLTRWSHPYVPYAHAHALAHAMHLLDHELPTTRVLAGLPLHTWIVLWSAQPTIVLIPADGAACYAARSDAIVLRLASTAATAASGVSETP